MSHHFIPNNQRLYYRVATWSRLRRYFTTGFVIVFILTAWWLGSFNYLLTSIQKYRHTLVITEQNQSDINRLTQEIKEIKQRIAASRTQLPSDPLASIMHAADQAKMVPQACTAQKNEQGSVIMDITMNGSFNAFMNFLTLYPMMPDVVLQACTIKRINKQLLNISLRYLSLKKI